MICFPLDVVLMCSTIVDDLLEMYRLPSPVGTFLLRPLPCDVGDGATGRIITRRILNYISPHPWGSLAACCHRRTTALASIVSRLTYSKEEPKAFCSGAGVQWVPLLAHFDKMGAVVRKLKLWRADDASDSKWRLVWRAQRQKPTRKIVNSEDNPLVKNLTDELRTALLAGVPGCVDILWDCRFLLTFDVAAMPDQLKASVLNGRLDVEVRHESDFFYPHVQLLATTPTRGVIGSLVRVFPKTGLLVDSTPWIKIAWIRPLHQLLPESVVLH